MKVNLLKQPGSYRMRIVLASLICIILVLIIAIVIQPGAFKLVGAALKNSTTTCADISQIPAKECAALQALHTSTSGQEWLHAGNWFQSEEPCTWYGVICTGTDTEKHIAELYLSNNGMIGPLPVELDQLENLTKLGLQGNQINSTIPIELTSLDQLTWLDLSQNQLTGLIPAEFGEMKNLEILSLSYNQLSGPIPPELGELKALRILYLNYNQLDGPIPAELGACTQLQQLYLSGNQLTGEIPPELGELANLVALNLEANDLTGAIPAELGKLANLERLFIQDNRLTGALPEGLSALSMLVSLAISSNSFSGAIPDSYVSLNGLSNENGHMVDFGYNMLTTDNQALSAFLAVRDPTWQNTQTIPPGNLTAQSTSDGIQLTWSPIAYHSNTGYYEISYSTSLDGPYTVHGTTTDKADTSYLATGLTADQEYYFRIRTHTPPHPIQKNELWSAYTSPVKIIFVGQMSIDISNLQHPIFLPLVRK